MTGKVVTVRARLRRASVRAGVLALIGAAAWWSLGPVRLPEPPTPVMPPKDPAPVDQREVAANWDVQAFRTPIWVAPPPAPPPESTAVALAPPPPPPRNLQLLAIVEQDGRYRAVIYDQDQDRLFTVSTGEPIAGRTVAEIDAISITLADGATQSRLVLDPGRAGAAKNTDSTGRVTP